MSHGYLISNQMQVHIRVGLIFAITNAGPHFNFYESGPCLRLIIKRGEAVLLRDEGGAMLTIHTKRGKAISLEVGAVGPML